MRGWCEHDNGGQIPCRLADSFPSIALVCGCHSGACDFLSLKLTLFSSFRFVTLPSGCLSVSFINAIYHLLLISCQCHACLKFPDLPALTVVGMATVNHNIVIFAIIHCDRDFSYQTAFRCLK